jgi:phosphonate transport system substrate-binding protein
MSANHALNRKSGTRLSRPLKPLLAAALVLALTGGTKTASADISLVFGTYAADKPTATVLKFKPLLQVVEQSLSDKLKQPVRIRTQISTDYGAAIDALVDGKVDFARFGPASYISAKRRNAGIKLLALEAVKGKKTFNGIICVRQDSQINNLADLRGRSFAFGSQFSTIGRYLSQQQLMNHGVRSTDLARHEYLGRHDRVGMAVANGEFDAGALKESTFKKLVAKSVPLRMIASFPNVTKPWIARKGISPEVETALRQTLLELKDPAALKALKKSGFLEASDDDFDVIRKAIENSIQFSS